MKLSLQHWAKVLRRVGSILMAAYMLGISNVILEENRMINNSRKKVGQEQVQDEDDQL